MTAINTEPSDTFLADLVTGFAVLLGAADIGVKWRGDDTPYAADECGIGLMSFPLALNRAVALSPYPLTDDPAAPVSEIGLQIKTRSAGEDPRDVWQLDGSISNVLLGNYPVTLTTGVRVHTLERTSSGSLGQDTNSRWQWVSNYPLNLYRPTPHRV